MQQWTGVCIVPLKPVQTASPHERAPASPLHQTLGAAMRLDAAVEESQQAPKDAEMMQSGQQLLADQGPVTRAKYAKRHSEPLYSPRLSPTQIKHASAGSQVTVAQQACAQLLRHEPAVPSVSSPQPASSSSSSSSRQCWCWRSRHCLGAAGGLECGGSLAEHARGGCSLGVGGLGSTSSRCPAPGEPSRQQACAWACWRDCSQKSADHSADSSQLDLDAMHAIK